MKIKDDKKPTDESVANPNTDETEATPAPVELEDCPKCVDYLNGWRRAQADYQNLQKEIASRQDELLNWNRAGLVLDLLPVVDNFTEALKHVSETDAKLPWVTGIFFIKKQLEDLLTDWGVEKMSTIGEKFDPERHEAVLSTEEEKKDNEPAPKDSGIIKEEVRAGYLWKEKVLRPARVIIN